MNNDHSRRKFIGGAGILSAGLVLTAARRAGARSVRLSIPAATKDIVPFKVDVPQAALDDLKERLANTRWPDKETVTDWSQGVPLTKAQSLVEYWRDKYDWRGSRLASTPSRSTEHRSTGLEFTSSTCAPLTGTRCRSFSRTDAVLEGHGR
jgi:hypothetical protein